MTPGARYQAAIEILDSYGANGPTMERHFAAWVKSHRFAGSRDRAFIKDLVYAALRRRSEWAAVIGSNSARAVMLGFLVREQGATLADVQAIFSGTGYHPSALSDEEKAALKASTAQQISRDSQLNIPEWLKDETLLEIPKGSSAAREWQAMATRAPLDLRVNTLKARPEDIQKQLAEEGYETSVGQYSKSALRVAPRTDGRYPNMRALSLYHEGLIEIQDEGPQVAALLADAQPGHQVLDLCAGGGGKSLAMAATMQNKGQLFATDIGPARIKNAKERFDRAGLRNVQSRAISPYVPELNTHDPDFEAFRESFDRVFLDVPCSGSGVWRRHPDMKWRFTSDRQAAYAADQASLLDRAAPLVKPGGRLIYATCSMLNAENSAQIEGFLKRSPHYRALDIGRIWQDVAGLSAETAPTEDTLLPYQTLLMTPESAKTDGTFVALLERCE